MIGNSKVLVAGGGGNLGSWICRHLAKQGAEVTIASRCPSSFVQEQGFDFVSCDVTSKQACIEALFEKDFDSVVYLSSANDFTVPDYYKHAIHVNVLGLRNVLEVLKTQNLSNFIYFSTFHVYGASCGVVDESTPLMPVNDYGLSHALGEEQVRFVARTHGLPYVILRLTNSYGCPTHKETDKWSLVLNDLCRLAYEQLSIRMSSDGAALRDYVWMGDVASVVERLLSMSEAPSDTYNLSYGKSFSVKDVASCVQRAYCELYSKELPIVTGTVGKPTAGEELLVSNQKLKSLLNFIPENRLEREARAILKNLSSLEEVL